MLCFNSCDKELYSNNVTHVHMDFTIVAVGPATHTLHGHKCMWLLGLRNWIKMLCISVEVEFVHNWDNTEYCSFTRIWLTNYNIAYIHMSTYIFKWFPRNLYGIERRWFFIRRKKKNRTKRKTMQYWNFMKAFRTNSFTSYRKSIKWTVLQLWNVSIQR